MNSDSNTTDQSLIQEEAIAAVPLISFIMVLLVGLVVLVFVASYWFDREAVRISQEHATEASYPQLERLEINGMQQLNRYEVLDNGLFRIPVEQAMHRVAEEYPDETPISQEMLP
ncbi:MAG: hypothetical protein OXE59_11720 [Bacteroidetes bacterium]|nr:hypothetical protein [Bacteroidota bacterium]